MSNPTVKKALAAAILIIMGGSLSACVVAPPRPYYTTRYVPVYHSYWAHGYYR